MESRFELKSEWNKALVEKNCCILKKLLPKVLREDERLLQEGWTEDRQTTTWVQEKSQRRWKGRTPLHAAASRGDVQLLDQILRVISCNGTPGEGTGGGDGACPSSANCHVLKVVDGDYDLDALAMAVVNGNKAIVTSLKEASLRCKSNPYNISADQRKETVGTTESHGARADGRQKGIDQIEGAESTAQNYAPGLVLAEDGAIMVETQRDWEHKRTLSEETQNVLKNLKESDRQDIEDLYAADCDFNFLDISVYLFHFTFSTWKTRKELNDAIGLIQVAIFSAVTAQAKEQNPVLKYLLFKLKDGQGRTALHVAVDSGSQSVDRFLYLIASVSVSGNRSQNEPEICSDSCSSLTPIFQCAIEDHPDPDEDDYHLDYYYLNTTDSAGRTPLYRAAARNNYFAVQRLLEDKRTNVNARIAYSADKWGADLDLDKLSTRNGFRSDCVYIPEKKLWRKGFNNDTNALDGPGPYLDPVLVASSTALHVAIIHKYDLIVKALLDHDALVAKNHSHSCPLRKKVDLSCYRRFTWPVTRDPGDYKVQGSVSPMQLSVLVGNIPVQRLLEYQQLKQKRKGSKSQLVLNELDEENAGVPTLLLAAAMGNSELMKAFIDSGHNPLIEHYNGNTALHYALNGTSVELHPHFIDFVGCGHVYSSRWENNDLASWLAEPEEDNYRKSSPRDEDDKSKLAKTYVQRRGATNLLLQSRVNIWAVNYDGRTAHPRPDAPEDFVSWWYEQVETLTHREQKRLSTAANAISVTSALVATTSYGGPFIPPLGYDVDSVQTDILAVRIFVVCSSISFYFALAAIMFALLPSIPMPHESTFAELRKTRIQVAIALLFLLPSIASVLVAFAASYIAVLPGHGSAHHALTFSSTVVGGIICLVVINRFLLRLANVLLTLPRGEVGVIREFFTGDEVTSFQKNLRQLLRPLFTSW